MDYITEWMFGRIRKKTQNRWQKHQNNQNEKTLM